MIIIRRSDFHRKFDDRISVRNLIAHSCGQGFQLERLSLPLAIHSSAFMPPKKTSEPPLSEAESLLMKIAARIFTAVKYKENHPDEDHSNFQRNMTMEMVRESW